jgi:integrase/recombinase XerD
VSCRNKGKGLSTRTISSIIKNALRDIGLDDKKLSAHSLRHTAINLAIKGGASLHQAQAMAGHKDPRTTMTYFHNQQRIEEAAEKSIVI